MSNKSIKFSRRVFFLFIIKIVLFVVIVIRLFYLQINKNYYFTNLSDKNRINLLPIIPKRGIIYDYFNVVIADNLFLWQAVFIKSQINQDINVFINTISSIINIDEKQQQRIIKDYKHTPAYIPIVIKEELNQSEIAAIETFSYNLQGVFIKAFFRRNYPFNEVFAHAVGYVSNSNDKSIIDGWQVGKYGLEYTMDSFLKGSIGYSKYEIDAHGNVKRYLEKSSAVVGNNVSITIDYELQLEIYQLLSEFNSGSCIVSDVENGNILAMVSYPSFDPNIFTTGISDNIWQAWVSDEKTPLSNKSIMALYPPGSVIKPIFALEALESDLININSTVNCKGYIDIGAERFHCWKKEGHGEVNVSSAISESCDVFFYNLASFMKVEQLIKSAKLFGFGEKHLNFLQSELKGNLVDKKRIRYLGHKIIAMIGQGDWLVTTLQINKMMSLLARPDLNNKFNIIKNIDYNNKLLFPKNNQADVKLAYKDEYIKLIRKALFNVVNKKKGSGVLARTYIKGWDLSGKTGTSQVRHISSDEHKSGIVPNHLLPWKQRDHALFSGFVPYDKPAYAISIILEHGGGSSVTTSPMAGKIARKLYERHALYQKEKAKVANLLNNRS